MTRSRSIRHRVASSIAVALLACAWTAGAWAAPPLRRDIHVVDVTPTAFTVAWTADAASTGTLQVFRDVLGTVPATGIQIEPSVVRDGDPSVATSAQDLGVLWVRVSRLEPETPYFFRTVTTPKGGGVAAVVPASGACLSAVTETASFPETANSLAVQILQTNGTTPQPGALLVVTVTGASHPLSGIAQDGYADAVAAVDLANLYKPSDGTTLRLNGGEQAQIVALGGLGGRASATQALATNNGLGVLQLLGSPLVLQPAVDSDGDGMPDDYEMANGFNRLSGADAAQDADGDGLTNVQEYRLGTDPHVTDTDGDGLSDGTEVSVRGTLATEPDTDRDGRSDGAEVNGPIVTNPLDADSDNDGVDDGTEVARGTNPNDPNSFPVIDHDGDGVGDLVDNCPTVPNPAQADTDHDGLGDACDPDDDNDGILDGADNCGLVANAGQADVDSDGVGDACDNCVNVANPGQQNHDSDALGDACDLDDDNDGVNDFSTPPPPADAPFMLANATGIVGSTLPVVSSDTAFVTVEKFFVNESRSVRLGVFNLKTRTFTPVAVAPADQARMGWLALGMDVNHCGCFTVLPGDTITIQTDVGNITAVLPANAQTLTSLVFVATDGSAYLQFFVPNGPLANLLQSAQVAGPLDNCRTTPNPAQTDADGDGIGDACDNCPLVANPGQEDANGNGFGDVCEPSPTPTPTITLTPTRTPTPTITPTPAPPAVNLGKGVGRPGGTACVGGALAAAGAQVAGTRNDMSFDASLFTLSGCVINPAIGPASAANKQLSVTPLGVGLQRVGVGTNPNVIPDGTLYGCTLTIGAGVAVGTYSVGNTSAASDPAGADIGGVIGQGGQVLVTTCTGDCDGNGHVTIGEVIKCVNMFLGQPFCNAANPTLGCPVADASLNGTVSIGEVTQCVNRFLNGC